MIDNAVKVYASGSEIFSRTSFRRLPRLLVFGLLALLIQSPVYATEPIDVDPDPDTLTTIVVQASEEQTITMSLQPGHYLIVVVHADGSTTTYELHK